MESLYLLIPISVIFIAIAIRLFFWAVNSGQYDDLDSEGERILFDRESSVDELEKKEELDEIEGLENLEGIEPEQTDHQDKPQ
jgi:cbb3-type cytochrome oxidase maturation protein